MVKPTIKDLKKTKNLMGKWTIGKKYIKGFADLKNGRASEIRIFELKDYDVSIKFQDEEDTFYNINLTLLNLDTGEKITIDQDDRYGHYALLDNKRIANIKDTYEEAQHLAYVLEDVIKKI